MPNGRSGGFRILKTTLADFLVELNDDAVIGILQLCVPKKLTTEEARQILQLHRENDVWVKEQDNSCYILHLETRIRYPPGETVIVTEQSPLFPYLRRFHA